VLIHPTTPLEVVPGTPFVQNKELSRFMGLRVYGTDPQRAWAIQAFLTPSSRRALGGVRTKLLDQKGFVTFINQRDLEVLLGLGTPGQPCFWLKRRYPEPGDCDWVGFYSDEEDLTDDLYEQELLIRCDYPLIPEGTTVTRRIHIEDKVDIIQTDILLWDADLEQGLCPDPRRETITNRWKRVERENVLWGSLTAQTA